MKSLVIAVVSTCLALFLVSCSSKPNAVSGDQTRPMADIQTIAVLPVQTLAEEGRSLTKSEEEQLRQGAMMANGVLQRELAGNDKVRLISPIQLDRIGGGITGGLGATIARVGEELGCDGVLVTTMRRYIQRQGGEYAVDSPASASFKMQLYDVKTKSVVWAADFNETQESLFADILSFGKAQSRGFKWITVEDLVSQGINERLAELPYL